MCTIVSGMRETSSAELSTYMVAKGGACKPAEPKEGWDDFGVSNVSQFWFLGASLFLSEGVYSHPSLRAGCCRRKSSQLPPPEDDSCGKLLPLGALDVFLLDFLDDFITFSGKYSSVTPTRGELFAPCDNFESFDIKELSDLVAPWTLLLLLSLILKLSPNPELKSLGKKIILTAQIVDAFLVG